ncbi:hypothetical protein ACLMJK_006495 [Lecanora helva]
METARSHSLSTILLVQGSFQVPQVYEKLVRGLETCGYLIVQPRLPSCSATESPDFPQRSLLDDAMAVRSELSRLIDREGRSVIVVMHSYGGLVGSEAITEELTVSQRKAQSLQGGVSYLFFYSAFLLDEGQSVLSAFGESPNNDVKPDGRFFLKDGAQKLYNDLPPSEASYWESRLIAESYKVQTTVLTHAAWRYVPSTYLICENDQAVPVPFQEMFATKANARVDKCSSGHSPHLSQPEMLVQKIHRATQEVTFAPDLDV